MTLDATYWKILNLYCTYIRWVCEHALHVAELSMMPYIFFDFEIFSNKKKQGKGKDPFVCNSP